MAMSTGWMIATLIFAGGLLAYLIMMIPVALMIPVNSIAKDYASIKKVCVIVIVISVILHCFQIWTLDARYTSRFIFVNISLMLHYLYAMYVCGTAILTFKDGDLTRS